MITIIDLQDMPGFNPSVPNGKDSVTRGDVYLAVLNFGSYPYCKKHGAMLKVSKDGIWRCGVEFCPSGCYQKI